MPRPEHNPEARPGFTPDHVLAARDHFWQNIVIETLTTFALIAHEQKRDTNGDGLIDDEDEPARADGRFGVVTRLGDRIPVSNVTPMMACSIIGSEARRTLSEAVQCSVFQIETPAGEVHTLPASEVAAFHALTPELIARLNQAQQRAGEIVTPFGFAAFTNLARTEQAALEAEAEASRGGREAR